MAGKGPDIHRQALRALHGPMGLPQAGGGRRTLASLIRATLGAMHRRVLLLAVLLLTLLPADALARAGGGSHSFGGRSPSFGGGGFGSPGRGFGGGHHFFFFGGGGGGSVLLIIIIIVVVLFLMSRRGGRGRGRRS